MTTRTDGRKLALTDTDETSMLVFGSALLRRRRLIAMLGLTGGVIGLASGLLSARVYSAKATFVPQGVEGTTSGLAAAASQFGIRVPTSGGGWGPPLYVALLRSRTLLEPIAKDTVVVAELSGRRVALMDLLDIQSPSPERRVEAAVRALNAMVKSDEVKEFAGVEVTATTKWPSVSLALVDRLVNAVNQFNLQTRKSQAAAERQFVESRAAEAETTLRVAEDRLQTFLQQNRAIVGSPELAFTRDRLQRDLALRQQVYNSLVQSREEARIREVRDTPVITVLEAARLPTVSEARKSIQKGVFGGFVGLLLGVMFALTAQRIGLARQAASDESREFFSLLRESIPRFLGRQRE